MKLHITLLILLLASTQIQAQFLKKLKQRAEQAINKTVSTSAENKQTDSTPASDAPASPSDNTTTATANTGGGKQDLNVYSKFDFVPGKKFLIYC